MISPIKRKTLPEIAKVVVRSGTVTPSLSHRNPMVSERTENTKVRLILCALKEKFLIIDETGDKKRGRGQIM